MKKTSEKLSTLKNNVKIGLITLMTSFATENSFAQSQDKANTNRTVPICSTEDEPYRDFDFIVGNWEYRTTGGHVIGEQVITKQGEGCTIIEEWTEVSGITGRGMSFVDPTTGLWRQVWMSSRFHIDYSGGLNENGAMVLEGTMYPTNGDISSRVRGVWTKQTDGSIKKEFLRFDKNTNKWITFFDGFAHPKKD